MSLLSLCLKLLSKQRGIDLKVIAGYVKTRIGTINEIADMVDFIDNLPEYETDLYVHKKMKTTEENSLENLKKAVPMLEALEDWTNDSLYNSMVELCKELEIKNGQMLWPIRTALSGKPTSPCGASELAELLGKEETLKRIQIGIDKLSK